MPLEPSVTYISDLNPLWPVSGDAKFQGDDHIRYTKNALRNSFPLVKGPVNIAHDQFASKNDVAQAAFSAVLPGQPAGTLTYGIVSQYGVATWKRDDINSSTERLAQVQAAALSF
jgi:hypothetical protein